jgi:hypothetical protein
MTTPDQSAEKKLWSLVPRLKSPWWTVLLGLSLMANLAVGGMSLGYRYGGGSEPRMAAVGVAQLVPRSFLWELPRERRRELARLVNSGLREMGGSRAIASAQALRFADVIEKSDLSAQELQAAINTFATGSDSLAAKSALLAQQVLSKLTPEERAKLAKAIRERARQKFRR